MQSFLATTHDAEELLSPSGQKGGGSSNYFRSKILHTADSLGIFTLLLQVLLFTVLYLRHQYMLV